MNEKIKLFEPEEEPKKKKPRKFNDDKSWIGIVPKLGCDKKKDCSRNGTESKESQETGKKLGKEEGSNPKQPLGLWDEMGEKSGIVDLRKKCFGTKMGVLTRKEERESIGDSKSRKPQPILRPEVRKKKYLDNDKRTPKGILDGHCEVIGDRIREQNKMDQ